MQSQLIIGATLLLLAGGDGRRMGRPKSLLPVAGSTLAEWQVARLHDHFEATMLAVASLDQLPESLHRLAVLDRSHGRGPLGGLEAGLAAARTRSVFVLACDVPSLTADQASLLVGRLGEAGGADAAVAGSAVHPEPLVAAYRREPALRAVEAALSAGERRLTDLLQRLEVEYVELGPMANLNSPSDYQAFLDN